MTREEAIQELKRIQSMRDKEQAHVSADFVLESFLEALGYEDVVAEYVEIDKWYA